MELKDFIEEVNNIKKYFPPVNANIQNVEEETIFSYGNHYIFPFNHAFYSSPDFVKYLMLLRKVRLDLNDSNITFDVFYEQIISLPKIFNPFLKQELYKSLIKIYFKIEKEKDKIKIMQDMALEYQLENAGDSLSECFDNLCMNRKAPKIIRRKPKDDINKLLNIDKLRLIYKSDITKKKNPKK